MSDNNATTIATRVVPLDKSNLIATMKRHGGGPFTVAQLLKMFPAIFDETSLSMAIVTGKTFVHQGSPDDLLPEYRGQSFDVTFHATETITSGPKPYLAKRKVPDEEPDETKKSKKEKVTEKVAETLPQEKKHDKPKKVAAQIVKKLEESSEDDF